MTIVPYGSPVLPEYRGTAFEQARRAVAPVVRAMLVPDPTWSIRANWMIRRIVARRRRPAWQPKLYVCIRARHYWRAVAGLVAELREVPVDWKFHFDRGGYDRPDKIVLYLEPGRDPRAVIQRVRAAVDGHAFHELRHAAPTSVVGLEPRGRRGLYVGSDPVFLGPSWRIYRAVCVAWLAHNRAWVGARVGGERGWRAAMNLASHHEGPARLEPPGDTLATARRLWRLVTGT